MKFRDYGEVEPVIVAAKSPHGLCGKIDALGKKRDLIDLQYSTTTLDDGGVEYSALALAASKTKKGTDR